MVDWRSEELFVEKTKNTASTMRRSFPNAEIMLRIKTTPTSVVAISVYPSQRESWWGKSGVRQKNGRLRGCRQRPLVSRGGGYICSYKLGVGEE